MRVVLIAILLFTTVHAASALETTRRLLESGAPRLALDRIERQQPPETKSARWAEWELLRLEALFALERYEDLLKRAEAHAGELPERERRRALALAARAALEAGRPEEARHFVARALWESGALPEDERQLRLVVIESYLAEGNGDTAFRTMLKFTQDYHPIDHDTAARFVTGLIALDMAREAANWLARLEEGSPAKEMLRLKAGLVKPDAAIAQARTRLAKGGDRGYWKVIAEAAARGGKPSVRIEALEERLQHAAGRKEVEATAAQLWEIYQASAEEAANANHLLVGDDTAWAKYASERREPDPFMARAFFAYLAHRARSLEARQAAYRQLVLSLARSKLERVALRLFNNGDIALTGLDADTRFRLGSIAETQGDAAVAARLWDGLATPSGMTKTEWETRRALVFWRAGNAEAAVKALAVAASEKQTLPAKAVQDAISLAQAMAAADGPQLTDASLSALLQLVGPEHQRELLMALGNTAEASGRFARAGGYFLQAALAPDGRTPVATASKARLAAALNLARAGYKEDARAQFEWVIHHSRDAAEREVARKGQATL